MNDRVEEKGVLDYAHRSRSKTSRIENTILICCSIPSTILLVCATAIWFEGIHEIEDRLGLLMFACVFIPPLACVFGVLALGLSIFAGRGFPRWFAVIVNTVAIP